MKVLSFHRLLFRLGIAIVLVVLVSAAWKPHILKGKELLLVRGSSCTGSRTCEDHDCPSGCTLKKDETCTKIAPSTTGCWQVSNGSACGTIESTGKPCGGYGCSGCNPCS